MEGLNAESQKNRATQPKEHEMTFMSIWLSERAKHMSWICHGYDTADHQQKELNLGDAVDLEQFEMKLGARVGCLHQKVDHEEGDAHGR